MKGYGLDDSRNWFVQCKLDDERSFWLTKPSHLLRVLYADEARVALLHEHPVSTIDDISESWHGAKWRRSCRTQAVQHDGRAVSVQDFFAIHLNPGQVGVCQVREIFLQETIENEVDARQLIKSYGCRFEGMQ
jgi:hypothetical protein